MTGQQEFSARVLYRGSGEEIQEVATPDPLIIENTSESDSISGTVRDSNGTPVTGTSIEIWLISGDPCGDWELVGIVRTDPFDGKYSVSDLSPGNYYLRTSYYGTDYVNEWWTGSGSVRDCADAQSVTTGGSGKDFHLDPYAPTNRPPVANSGTLVTDQGTPKSGKLTASDEDGDNLTYIKVSDPEKGSVTITAKTGDYVYRPDPDQTGADSFAFKVSDGSEDSNIATVTVSVIPATPGDNKKAIIVAGSGPYDGNNLWESTWTCTNYAYRAALFQEYRKENVYYLSPVTNADIDGNGVYNDDVDADATYENLKHAVTEWAKDPLADELLIYMTGHGRDGIFILNGTTKPVQTVTAQELGDWLNDLQKEMTGRIIFIYDACRAGTFLSRMIPPEGKERIVVTSSSADESAYFLDNGKHSFSFHFWADIYNGAELDEAFFYGRNMMEKYQQAILDADGDGIGNSKTDKTLAKGIGIGRGIIPASDMLMPTIDSISDNQTLEGNIRARLRAEGVQGVIGVNRVWAVIIPPGYDASPESPVTDPPMLELRDLGNTGVYEGVYEEFTMNGTYSVTVYAEDTEGIYSLPLQTTVTQTGIIVDPGDVNGDGDINLADAIAALRAAAGGPGHADKGADVSGDSRIGMEEVLYLLRHISGLR